MEKNQKMLVETANIIAKKLDTDETYENLFKRDKGLTDLFMEKYQSLIKLTNTSGDGYIWNPDTALWEDKPASYFLHVIQKFMESKVLFYIHKHSSGEHQDAEKIIKLTRVLDKVRDIKQAENIFKGAKGQLYVPDFQAKLNAISHLLPIKDQRVINLKTLETRDRSINDLFDFEIDIDFTDDMERYDFTDENEVTDYCKTQLPDAEKFFLQIMNGSNEIKTYLQMNLGYCLTGEINQRCIYIFWGCGSNGKSTVCDLMTKILNKLYVAVDKKVFIKDSSSGSHTAHLIPLVGARMAVFSESEKQEKLNEGLIKSLTGGDTISARALYGKQFTFKPVSKYILLTNHKPTFDVSDQAMLDRIRYIPFNARFTDIPKKGEYKKDVPFIDKLTNQNIEQVFKWLCIGAYKFYQHIEKKKPIEVPKTLQDEKDKYISELDSVQKFLNEKTEKTDSVKDRIDRSELYGMFQSYCVSNGEVEIKNSEFFKRLDKLEYESKPSNGKRYILNIKEKEEEE